MKSPLHSAGFSVWIRRGCRERGRRGTVVASWWVGLVLQARPGIAWTMGYLMPRTMGPPTRAWALPCRDASTVVHVVLYSVLVSIRIFPIASLRNYAREQAPQHESLKGRHKPLLEPGISESLASPANLRDYDDEIFSLLYPSRQQDTVTPYRP